MRAVGLAGVAIAAVAAVGIVLLPRVGSPGVDVAGVPSGPREVSWASGSTIHHGDAELDVSPWVVQAYVQTDDGFVFTDPDGGVHLAMASGTEQIGSGDADGRYLRADDSGPGDSGHHVAWIDSSDTTPALVVYDTLAREVVLDTTEHFRAGMGTLRDDDSAFVYAVDGGYVYVRDGEGLSRVNIADGSFEPLATGVEGFDVADVTNGLIAHERPKPVTSFSGEDIPMTMVLGRAYTANGSRIPAESQLLSPDARYVVTDYNDSEQVFEVATGDDVTPSLPGGGSCSSPTGWTKRRRRSCRSTPAAMRACSSATSRRARARSGSTRSASPERYSCPSESTSTSSSQPRPPWPECQRTCHEPGSPAERRPPGRAKGHTGGNARRPAPRRFPQTPRW
jgi:hypothetical protein